MSNRPFSERKQVVANVRGQVVAGESVSAAEAAVLLDEHDQHASLVDRLADRYVLALAALRRLVDRHDEALRGREDGSGWQKAWDQAFAVVDAKDRDPGGVVARLRAIEAAAGELAAHWDSIPAGGYSEALRDKTDALIEALVAAVKNGDSGE